MSQKWYKKASVQTALVTSAVLMIATLIQVLYVQKVKSENETLRHEIEAKTLEIQRLETVLVPFKTIALERYSGTETEALGKLAERIKTIEQQLGEVDKLRDIASKHEFTPLKPELEASMIKSLSVLKEDFASQSITIQISYETWASEPTRRFAEQLATILKSVGLKVSGPTFQTIFLVGPEVSAFEIGYNKEQQGIANRLFIALQQIIKPNGRFAQRQSLDKGTIRLHFGGQVVFDPSGSITIE